MMNTSTARLAAFAMGLAMFVAAPCASAALPPVDHIVLGAPDLTAGSEAVAKLVGVAPVMGGVHPDRGTANALMSLGPQTYLEILAPAPGQPARSVYAEKLAALPGLNIQTFAVQAPDLDRVAAAARKAGLTVEGPIPGSRKTGDGTVLQWRMLNVGGHEFNGLVPFFIDWGTSRHPAVTSPAGATFGRLTAVHPRAAELAALYRALGLDIPVAAGPKSMLVLEFSGKAGRVILTGDPQGL